MTEKEFVEILRNNYKRMLLTKKETAQELNISIQTLDRMRKNGELKSTKVLGSIMFSLNEIARFACDA
jgi:DNA-binding Xre family transcriptional regulator